jgi:AraC-like DNA-binding protein
LEYKEFAPSRRLAPIVSCLWTLEGHADEVRGEEQAVLPDGRPEVIVHLGDPFDRVHAGAHDVVERQACVIFAGQITNRLILRPSGRVAVLGIRLHADGAPAIIRSPQDGLAGRTPALDDLSASLARALNEVRDSGSLADAVSMAQDRLEELVSPAELDARVRHVVGTILRRRGRLSIDEAAREVGLTRRHLERRFRRTVGISPKRLARITRFQHALRLLERQDGSLPAPGTSTAAECGYADQAHFIRDFKDLAGCAPGEHLLRRAELTGFFTPVASAAARAVS